MKFLLLLSISLPLLLTAKENKLSKEQREKVENNRQERTSSGCFPATTQVDLDINNVRATINIVDKWWDLVGRPRYEVPKVTDGGVRRHSMFAGSLWIGGFDRGGNLRLAAQTYRQSGNDYWPGPLDTTNASIGQEDCARWDKIWRITRDEVDDFIEQGPSAMTEDIQNWPGNGDVTRGESEFLAPYVSVSGSPSYNPFAGDYPDILGDQALWYVYNDRGNAHTESEAQSIGLEVRVMAFAYATNDEINDMTFYESTVINRSRDRLDSVYFGNWADPDVGFAFDDFVGCDVDRDLGYCYNGTDFDPGVDGYGANPPSIGIDFFQGPINQFGEELGMSKFVFYNNTFADNGNPQQPQHYYNYLIGRWKNNEPMRFGGNGFTTATGGPTDFMYPDDPRDPAPAWSEVTAGNAPGDRRFLQTSGPFSLLPGAINQVTIGVVWARASSGGNTGSLDRLFLADDKAQLLFNNNFELIDGPDAPDLNIIELDRELVITFDLDEEIENYADGIVAEDERDTIRYFFEGYKIYQLRNSSVSAQEFMDTDVSRLVAQVDKKNGITNLVNTQTIPGLGRVPTMMVEGNDQGIRRTFRVSRDEFASEDDRLVNFKRYHYAIVSYAAADPTDSVSARADEQYLEGRRNVRIYTVHPSPTSSRFGGAEVQANYGDGPEITRLEGQGNGGLTLELAEGEEERILEDGYRRELTYAKGAGPVDIFVFDPLNVPSGDFELIFNDDENISEGEQDFELIGDSATNWVLRDLSSGEEYTSQFDLLYTDGEQIFKDVGLAIRKSEYFGPSYNDSLTDDDRGAISSDITFEDVNNEWLTGVTSASAPQGATINPNFWIRCGTHNPGNDGNLVFNSHRVQGNYVDEFCNLSFLDGRLAPYSLVATSRANLPGTRDGFTYGPRFDMPLALKQISRIPSIDVVFNNRGVEDKKYWTKATVIEMGEDASLNEGGAEKFDVRKHPSWENPSDISSDGTPRYNESSEGMSWFPGYAINIETGERMNVIFGEDSWLGSENGRDMLWNPTSNQINPAVEFGSFDRILWGGKHTTYFVGTHIRYGRDITEDFYYTENRAREIRDRMQDGARSDKEEIHSAITYAMIPLVREGYMLDELRDGLIPSEARIKVRMKKRYETYTPPGRTQENNGQPFYRFNTDDIAVLKGQDAEVDVMEKVNIVPNPYYAYSGYETNQLETRVRITNLPQRCKISIFTISGHLVRRLEKDESEDDHQTYLDWDLRNHAQIPIASGLYIIHVDGYELGTKTLKWFGIMRPVDLDTF